MLGTTTIKVLRPTTVQDDFGDEVENGWAEEIVEDVLAEPGSSRDLDATRPEGVMVEWTFHLPWYYSESLRGCNIEFDGEVYSVIGDPQPYMHENCPGTWNRPVEVVSFDG